MIRASPAVFDGDELGWFVASLGHGRQGTHSHADDFLPIEYLYIHAARFSDALGFLGQAGGGGHVAWVIAEVACQANTLPNLGALVQTGLVTAEDESFLQVHLVLVFRLVLGEAVAAENQAFGEGLAVRLVGTRAKAFHCQRTHFVAQGHLCDVASRLAYGFGVKVVPFAQSHDQDLAIIVEKALALPSLPLEGVLFDGLRYGATKVLVDGLVEGSQFLVLEDPHGDHLGACIGPCLVAVLDFG